MKPKLNCHRTYSSPDKFIFVYSLKIKLSVSHYFHNLLIKGRNMCEHTFFNSYYVAVSLILTSNIWQPRVVSDALYSRIIAVL
jgi:hypothetical protein